MIDPLILTGLLRESQHQATERSPGVSISLIEFRRVTRGVDRREATDAERSTARAVAGDLNWAFERKHGESGEIE